MKWVAKILAISVVAALGLVGVLELTKTGKLPGVSNVTGTDYFTTGSEYKGNYIYGGAMQLAVNDLNRSILQDKLSLVPTTIDQETKRQLAIFNKAEFSTADLDSPSYYVKSGFGQETVNTINRETRAKFPKKTFGDLMVKLEPKDIIAYAYFLKEIEYATEFKKDSVQFLGQKVQGFNVSNSEQGNNVKIVSYMNDNQFIVKLNLKDNSDEIYLAKGYTMNTPKPALDKINQGLVTTTMGDDDLFAAPEIHLDMTRIYDGFTNKYLTNRGFESYYIGVMQERIKFDMDNKGARVENEAMMVMAIGSAGGKKEIKKLILDKPYWIIMKRANSKNPYFILGVKNTEIMEKPTN